MISKLVSKLHMLHERCTTATNDSWKAHWYSNVLLAFHLTAPSDLHIHSGNGFW